MIGLGVQAAHGELEVLQLPDPRRPEAGELLVEVVAAGVGPWDALLHTGGWDVDLVPPAALGVEGVGRIVQTSEGASVYGAGELVLVHEAPLPGGSGTWAERVLVRAERVARVPEGLDLTVAAGLPVAGLTAVQALDELRVGKGTRLLVVGASGPTASLAVQLASRRGADVVAGAGQAHAERLRAFGARDVIDTHVDGWETRTSNRFDAVLIAALGTAEKALALVEDNGRLISITLDAPASVRGIASADLYVQPDGPALGELAKLVAAGHLKLDVQAAPLRDGIAVANRVAEGRSGGVKHVLEL